MIARSIGAAPRQRGSSEGCTLRISWSREQRLAHERPVGAQARSGPDASAAISPASVLEALGLAHRADPRSRAPAATGVGATRRPRPRGAGGRVTTSAGSTARGGVEHRERERPSCRCRRASLARWRSRHARIASRRSCAARAVEHQDAVEVVDLVLEHARLEAGGLDRERRAVLVAAADAEVHEALDVDADAGDAEAALLERLGLLAVPLDAGG